MTSATYTELTLLKCCESSEQYERFKKFVKNSVTTEECKAVLEDIETYYADSKLKTINWFDFEVWFDAARGKVIPSAKAGIIKNVIKKLQDSTFTPNVNAVLQHYTKLEAVTKILEVCVSITTKGKGDILDIDKIVGQYMINADVDERRRAKYVSKSFSDCIADTYRNNGVDWQLEALNTGVGPVAPGDFIVVAARPNAGKSSFVLQSVAKFMEQMDGNALFVNNEEIGTKVKARFVQCALDKTRHDLDYMDPDDIDAAMIAKHKAIDRFHVVEADYLSIADVERAIAETKAKIVIFNTLDKLVGFDSGKENETARQRRLYQWARNVASRGIIVFAVGQAGEEAEGLEWISQNMIYGSKTGAAGEADLIVTIGQKPKDPAYANKRFIHTPKNKLPGGKRSNPAERHGFHTVDFNPETGCYED